MKKAVIGFAMALLLVFSASGAALAADGGNGSAGPNTEELSPSTSLQLMFAKMQLEQAELARNQAMEGMEEIQRLQDEQRQVAGFRFFNRKARFFHNILNGLLARRGGLVPRSRWRNGFFGKTMRRRCLISVPLSFDIHDMKLWGNVSFASMALSPSARADRKTMCTTSLLCT